MDAGVQAAGVAEGHDGYAYDYELETSLTPVPVLADRDRDRAKSIIGSNEFQRVSPRATIILPTSSYYGRAPTIFKKQRTQSHLSNTKAKQYDHIA